VRPLVAFISRDEPTTDRSVAPSYLSHQSSGDTNSVPYQRLYLLLKEHNWVCLYPDRQCILGCLASKPLQREVLDDAVIPARRSLFGELLMSVATCD
jgi:hypothetical protein